MGIIKFIPNFFTLANLALGVIGIYWINGNDTVQIEWVTYCVLLAAVFDFFDGFLAKALNARSAIGAQLDSLADLITFGVLPGFIYFHLLADKEWAALLLLVPICSAWRLAKFNVGGDQTESFKGISTTAHGIFVSTLLLLTSYPQTSIDLWLKEDLSLLILAVGFSLLMISNLKMVSLKFSNYALGANWDRYLLILGTLIFILIWSWSAAPFAMALYLLLSLYKHYTSN